jgi:hypothetical protein
VRVFTGKAEAVQAELRPLVAVVDGTRDAVLLRRGARMRLLASIHRSAWKENSATFALTEFSEVRTGLREVASCSCGGKGQSQLYATLGLEKGEDDA